MIIWFWLVGLVSDKTEICNTHGPCGAISDDDDEISHHICQSCVILSTHCLEKKSISCCFCVCHYYLNTVFPLSFSHPSLIFSSLPFSPASLTLPLYLLSTNISFPPLLSSFSPLIAQQFLSLALPNKLPNHYFMVIAHSCTGVEGSGGRWVVGGHIIIRKRLWFAPLQSDSRVTFNIPHLPGSAWICKTFVKGLLDKWKPFFFLLLRNEKENYMLQ